jgi:hypothetical protein
MRIRSEKDLANKRLHTAHGGRIESKKPPKKRLNIDSDPKKRLNIDSDPKKRHNSDSDSTVGSKDIVVGSITSRINSKRFNTYINPKGMVQTDDPHKRDYKKDITDLKAIKNLTKSYINSARLEQLSWAITNAELGSFKYFEAGRKLSSADLVRKILFNFRRNLGTIYKNDRFSCIADSMSDGAALFRDCLVDQIHGLTGSRPRIQLNAEEWTIFDS